MTRAIIEDATLERDLHLWVEDRAARLGNTDRSVVGLLSVELIALADYSSQAESHVLRVHVRCEGIGNALTLSGRN